jgi:hypothetical protein
MLTGEEKFQDIPVAEPIDIELAAIDRFEQKGVILRPGTKSANRPGFPRNGTADGLNEFA